MDTPTTLQQTNQAATTSRRAHAVCAVAIGLCAVSLAGCTATSTRTISTEHAEQMPYEERLSIAMRALDRGRSAQEAGDLARAESQFRSAIDILPDMGAAWNNLGLVMMTQDRTLEADTAFRNAADAMPSDPRPLINLGILLHSRGYATQARAAFLNALMRDPNHIEALRGAYVADIALRTSDQDMLERVSRALLVDADPVWQEKFAYQKLRLEQALRDKALEYR